MPARPRPKRPLTLDDPPLLFFAQAAEQLLGACSSIVGTTTPGTSLTETGIPTGSVSESASHSVTGGASPTASNSAVPSVSPPADAALGVVVSVGTWGWAVAAVMGAAAAL